MFMIHSWPKTWFFVLILAVLQGQYIWKLIVVGGFWTYLVYLVQSAVCNGGIFARPSSSFFACQIAVFTADMYAFLSTIFQKLYLPPGVVRHVLMFWHHLIRWPPTVPPPLKHYGLKTRKCVHNYLIQIISHWCTGIPWIVKIWIVLFLIWCE